MAPGGPRSPIVEPQAPCEPQAPDRREQPIGFWLLLALGLVLPFEAAVFSVGPLTITTVEVALYAVVAAWGLGHLAATRNAAGRRRLQATLVNIAREPVARAVALGLAVTVMSAFGAPDGHRVPALKFALRAVSGGLLFFAARDLAHTAAERRRLAGAIVLGAVLSALGAVVETVLPSASGLWHPFRTTTFSVTGLPRPSGPFAYPTIAAMYWEAALPLAIAVPLARRDPRHDGVPLGGAWTGTALALAGAALLVAATLFSATRTALAVAPLAAAAMLALTWRGSARPVRVATAGTLVVMALFAAATFASPRSGSPLAMRLRWWQDGAWYRARYTVGLETLTLPARSMEELPVTVANTGALTWPANGPDAVHLSYHWEQRDATGTHLEFDGWRSRLPFDVEPDATVEVLATVRTPEKPGHYRLRWDLVREQVTWFSERGSPTADQTVDVVASTPGSPRRPRLGGSAVVDASLEEWVAHEVPTRTALWLAALRLWRRHPLLGVGPDNFRHLYGQVMAVGRPNAKFDQRTHANSLYLETLADLGVAGVGALGLLMFALGRQAWRGIAATAVGVEMPRAPLEVAWGVALGTFFVHGLLDYFLPFTPAYGLYWILLAVAAGAVVRTEVLRPSTRPLPGTGSRDSTR